VEGIIQFIKMNSFSNVPNLNNTRYLHISPIKVIRMADPDEKSRYRNVMPLLHYPARQLKVLYNFKDA
jgi:hypothetical protein